MLHTVHRRHNDDHCGRRGHHIVVWWWSSGPIAGECECCPRFMGNRVMNFQTAPARLLHRKRECRYRYDVYKVRDSVKILWVRCFFRASSWTMVAVIMRNRATFAYNGAAQPVHLTMQYKVLLEIKLVWVVDCVYIESLQSLLRLPIYLDGFQQTN